MWCSPVYQQTRQNLHVPNNYNNASYLYTLYLKSCADGSINAAAQAKLEEAEQGRHWDDAAAALEPLIAELDEAAAAADAWLVVNVAETPSTWAGGDPPGLEDLHSAADGADDEKDAFTDAFNEHTDDWEVVESKKSMRKRGKNGAAMGNDAAVKGGGRPGSGKSKNRYGILG